MKVLVCGGREYDNWKNFKRQLNEILGKDTPIIVQGGAKGADFLARVYANYYGLNYKEYPANWKKYGNRAGPIRNQQMLDEENPDLVVAFPGGCGTADMVKRSKEQGFKVIEFNE